MWVLKVLVKWPSIVPWRGVRLLRLVLSGRDGAFLYSLFHGWGFRFLRLVFYSTSLVVTTLLPLILPAPTWSMYNTSRFFGLRQHKIEPRYHTHKQQNQLFRYSQILGTVVFQSTVCWVTDRVIPLTWLNFGLIADAWGNTWSVTFYR